MSITFTTEAGRVLCSRVNAGSLERGDAIRDEDGHGYRVVSVSRPIGVGKQFVQIDLDRPVSNLTERSHFRLRRNTPVWRETGSRAAGII